MFLSSLLVFLPFLATHFVVQAAEVIRRVGDIHVVNKEIAPDGLKRTSVLSNGAFPGPIITANKGENLDITVFDDLTDESVELPTSIHWHGIFSKGSIFDDGTPSVTQCPLVPGTSFRYQVATSNQAGTFWYHSHYNAQYCDGLRGALVIYDPNDPHGDLYDIDDESTIISLADWFHKLSPTWTGGTPPNATLINGNGRYPGGPEVPFSIINVEQGKRYRFRLIAMVCDPSYNFSIDQHQMTVIEADGVSHNPVTVDEIRIFAGQRYSFVLNADQKVDNYWLRANPNPPGISGFEGGINLAIVRYKGAPVEDPVTTEKAEKKQLAETELVPTENPGAPGLPIRDGAEVNIALNVSFDQPNRRFLVNNYSMTYPDVPVMLQILQGQTDVRKLIPKGSIYELPLNKSIEISFPTFDGSPAAPHPLHLHGHAFDVVRSAGSSVYNYDNPPRRDVVNIGLPGDNVTIRFQTDNTGPWILHCHIALHQEMGLSVVMVENLKGIKQSRPSAAWDELCPAYEKFQGKSTNSTELA